MDLRKLKTLVDLVSESNISELEITEAEGKVRIVKTPPPAIALPAGFQAAAIPAIAAAAAVSAAPPPAEVPALAQPSGHVVKSPMVGTF